MSYLRLLPIWLQHCCDLHSRFSRQNPTLCFTHPTTTVCVYTSICTIICSISTLIYFQVWRCNSIYYTRCTTYRLHIYLFTYFTYFNDSTFNILVTSTNIFYVTVLYETAVHWDLLVYVDFISCLQAHAHAITTTYVLFMYFSAQFSECDKYNLISS